MENLCQRVSVTDSVHLTAEIVCPRLYIRGPWFVQI